MAYSLGMKHDEVERDITYKELKLKFPRDWQSGISDRMLLFLQALPSHLAPPNKLAHGRVIKIRKQPKIRLYNK